MCIQKQLYCKRKADRHHISFPSLITRPITGHKRTLTVLMSPNTQRSTPNCPAARNPILCPGGRKRTQYKRTLPVRSSMVLMRLFCFRLSVRLGSIIVGGFCILETIVTMIALAALGGGQFLEQEALYYEENMHLYNPDDVFVWLIGVCKTEAAMFYTLIMIGMALYLPCCGTMMVGAYYMKRYLLVPFIVVELARLSCITLTHVIGMMVIKKSINVGYLIALTIAGGFALLLLFYLWACVVALMQILKIVRSPEYIAVFGDNPLAPIDPGETTPAGAFPTDPTTVEWNGSGFKPLQRNTISKNLERLPPTALTVGQFNGHNMLIDDFRPLHSRYTRSWAI
uniref:uncharacterized protein LOC120957670 isoform X1 n=1 Tax=Anopheles coluzzii TaxID=1518534 RepID=UPI0020FFB9F4|nr:uncharacterized protein LOC120957670 isoform X1 [Anopheles coluzzii]